MPAPRREELRSFGWILAGALAVFVALPFAPAIARVHRVEAWIVAAALAALAAAVPATLAPVYAVWSRIGKVLGWINTRILLGIVFFAVVLPLGLLRRARGRALVPRAADPSLATYRIARTPDPDPARFERPY